LESGIEDLRRVSLSSAADPVIETTGRKLGVIERLAQDGKLQPAFGRPGRTTLNMKAQIAMGDEYARMAAAMSDGEVQDTVSLSSGALSYSDIAAQEAQGDEYARLAGVNVKSS
jgi:hypothetical protein